jgi:hypothetical protein
VIALAALALSLGAVVVASIAADCFKRHLAHEAAGRITMREGAALAARCDSLLEAAEKLSTRVADLEMAARMREGG